MRTPVYILLLITSLLAAACSSSPGPDALSSKKPPAAGSSAECVDCHITASVTRRQIMGANGDFGANSSMLSHHVTGTAGNDPTSAQCLVCHDLSEHMRGTVLLRNADTGAAIAYDPSRPSTLEPFCLSCHDSDGATTTLISAGSPSNPFNDGAILGGLPPNLYQAGNKIASYWTGSVNRHKSVGGLTCAGSGQPGTGCHGSNGKINMHGSPMKGMLTNSMNFQIPLTFSGAGTFVYSNYKLCFDCHDSYPAVTKEVVLGYKQGGKYDVAWAPTPYYTTAIQTLFRDRFIGNPANYPAYWSGVNQPYNNSPLLQSYAPLHNFHLLGDLSWLVPGTNPLSWKYRGSASMIGRITCTACHNVHGTNGTVRSAYQEFGIIANLPFSPACDPVTGICDEYKTFDSIANFDDTVMKAYPINCNSSCHQNMVPPQTTYWHSPAGE